MADASIANSKPFLLRGPTLTHESQQMLQCFFVSAALLSGKLAGALVQLRGHFGGFFGWTAQRGQNLCELKNLHRKIQPRIHTDKNAPWRALSKIRVHPCSSVVKKLFHAVGGDNFDADEANAFLRLAPFAGTAGADGRAGDFREHIVAFDQFAERGVLAVEERGVAVADEKLAAGGIGICAARHGDDPALVGAVVELGLDGVAGAACAPMTFLAGVLGERIAALNHETLDDAVETGAVVKSFLGQCLEIFDGLGRDVGPELNDHLAFGGAYVGVFAHKNSRVDLLYAVCRNNFDADDAHAFVRAVRRMRWRRGDFFQHVVAFDQFAERGVLVVEKRRVAVADEKLRAGGIRVLRPRHGKDAARVRAVIELGLDLVTGVARAPHGFLAWVFGQRIAALNHEILDDAMKAGAVVESLIGEFLEIGDCVRRDLGPEFDDHGAFSRVDNGHFAGAVGARRLIAGGVVCLLSLAA